MHRPSQVSRSEAPAGTLSAYARAIRRNWVIASLVTLTAVASSIAWLSVRESRYEATAQVLVSPLSPADPTYFGLQLIRDSGDDPTRVLRTASTIVRSPQAAQRTAALMGRPWNPKQVLDSVEVVPQGQSSILEVTARANEPRETARLANTFTREALAVRRDLLRRQINGTLSELRGRQEEGGPGTGLSGRISQLETIRDGEDPTLSVVQAASPPTSQIGASTPVIVVLSLIVGLVLGAAAAILRELLNRRIRDEDEVLDLLPLPVLARVPETNRRARQSMNGAAWALPSPIHEAFRTVLIQLTSDSDESGRTIMVTSASSGDGKSTSAVNLAVSIAATGQSVILIDFDLRKPDVGRMLGLEEEQSLLSLVASDSTSARLADVLATVPGVPNLSVLAPIGMPDRALGFVETLHRRVPAVLAEAKELADFVVLDSAPLGEVSDALRLVDHVDDVIVVTRPGHTHRNNFEIMRDLLERTSHAPTGLLILDDTKAARPRYYDYGARYAGRRGTGKRRLARFSR